MYDERMWRDRLEGPLREVLAITDRTVSKNAAAVAKSFQKAVEAALVDAVLMTRATPTHTLSASQQPMSDAEWEAALKRTVSLLGSSVGDNQGDCGSESAQQATLGAVRSIETGFVWLSSRLHFTVMVSMSDDFTLCTSRREENEGEGQQRVGGSGLIDEDNPLAAPTPTIPDGVHLAVIALANAILALQRTRSRTADGVARAEGEEAPLLPSLRQPVMEMWFSFVLFFLQNMSSCGADAKGLWATFFADCREAVSKYSAERRRTSSKPVLSSPGASATKPPLGNSNPEIEAQTIWATTVSPALMADTVARTRFRRAAQLFRANTPHLLAQAPHTSFLVFDLFTQFTSDWTHTLASDVPLGHLTPAAETLLSVSLFDATSSDGAEEASTRALMEQLLPAERRLLDMTASFAAQLTELLAASSLHMQLVAGIIGSVLCALYALPAARQVDATARTVAPSSSPAQAAVGAGGRSAGSPPTPTQVIGRRATTSRSALTNSTFESLLSSHKGVDSGAVPSFPTESPNLADAKLRRQGTLPLENLDALEAQAWLIPRPLSDTRTSPHADYLCRDTEWRLRQFAPLGLLLKRAGLFAFVPPHLFYWSTQLKLGSTIAHHREGRQRVAMAALLTGVCNAQVALTMYHFAQSAVALTPAPPSSSTPPPTATASATSLPSVYAALGDFTRAMASFVCKADMERVVEVSASDPSGSGTASGLGVLQEVRKRSRRGERRGEGGEVAAETAQSHSPVFRHGELAGERFTRMVYPEPMPQWTHFLSQASSYAMSVSAQRGSSADSPRATGRTSTALAPECVTPLRFLMELLTARYFSLSAALIAHWWCQGEAPLNVFLVPRAALPAKEGAASVNAQLFLVLTTHRWLQHWGRQQLQLSAQASAEMAVYLTTQERILREELLPLWRLAHTFCARVDVLLPILTHCTRMTKSALDWLDSIDEGDVSASREENQEAYIKTVVRPRASATALVRRILATAELYVMQVILPCLRVMSPSPVLYDALHSLLEILEGCDWRVCYGDDLVRPLHIDTWGEYLLAPLPTTPARMHDPALSNAACHCRRYPHDVLQTRERHTLFVQSLKRMNAHTVDYYRRLLRPVWYADPLYVIERLFAQSIGYENNFLTQHTRLLHHVPPPILTLFFHRGIALMHQYASKERLDSPVGTTRVGLVAAFLCSVWSDNTDRVDGGVLVRAAELALRGDTRFDTVFGLELVKAMLYQLLHRTLEHEEQFNDVQCQALSTATTTRLFGRGQMESFRVGRWGPWMTPLRLQAGATALRAALAKPCDVPIEGSSDDDDDENEDNGHAEAVEETGDTDSKASPRRQRKVLRLSLGQHVLLHLARRQARIYALQADLDGTMETILATCARDFNTITDIIFALEELLPEGPPEALLKHVALPHVALRLSAKFRLKHVYALHQSLRRSSTQADASSSSAPAHTLSILEANIIEAPPTTTASESAVDAEVTAYVRAADAAWATNTTAPPSVNHVPLLSDTLLRDLSYFSVAHLFFDAAPYTAALREMEACRHRIDQVRALHDNGDCTADDMDDWLDGQQWQQEMEKAAHAQLYARCDGARAALQVRLEREVFASAEATYALGVSHLLPRALLNLEETTFVVTLLRWLLLDLYLPSSASSEGPAAAAASGLAEREKRVLCRTRVMDMTYSMITQAATVFVGLTDGEAKRYGYLLQRLVDLLQEAEVRLCGGTPPAGVYHALPPAVAAVVAEEEKRKRSAASVGVQESAATHTSGDATAAAQVGAGTAQPQKGAHALSSEAMAAAFGFPRALTAAIAVAPEGSSVPQPLLFEELTGQSTAQDAVETRREAEEPVDSDSMTGAAPASASESPASLLQLEAFLLRFFTSVLRDEVNVPSHLQRHVCLILERLDKRRFPSTRLGADLLLRTVKRLSHETNPNFASATAILKGLRDALRHKNALLGLLHRYTEEAMLSSRAAVGDSAAQIDALVDGTHITVTSAEAAAAMREWGKQWRLRENYMGQLLAGELQAAGMVGSTHEEEDDADEDADEAVADEQAEAEHAAHDEGNSVDGIANEEDDDDDDEGIIDEGESSAGSEDDEEDDEEDDSDDADDDARDEDGECIPSQSSGAEGDDDDENEDEHDRSDERSAQRRRLE